MSFWEELQLTLDNSARLINQLVLNNCGAFRMLPVLSLIIILTISCLWPL